MSGAQTGVEHLTVVLNAAQAGDAAASREAKSSKLGERISGLLQGDDEEEENPELCAKLGTKVLIMRVFLRWLLLFLLS